jgi:hypothetical protein
MRAFFMSFLPVGAYIYAIIRVFRNIYLYFPALLKAFLNKFLGKKSFLHDLSSISKRDI